MSLIKISKTCDIDMPFFIFDLTKDYSEGCQGTESTGRRDSIVYRYSQFTIKAIQILYLTYHRVLLNPALFAKKIAIMETQPFLFGLPLLIAQVRY